MLGRVGGLKRHHRGYRRTSHDAPDGRLLRCIKQQLATPRPFLLGH